MSDLNNEIVGNIKLKNWNRFTGESGPLNLYTCDLYFKNTFIKRVEIYTKRKYEAVFKIRDIIEDHLKSIKI